VSENSGRGVGLSAVLAAVNEVHGKVEIHSELGVGTRFVFTFHVPSLAPRRRPQTRRSLPPVMTAQLPVLKGELS
jgi:nitrogen-specific signal transduction histidine kinase